VEQASCLFFSGRKACFFQVGKPVFFRSESLFFQVGKPVFSGRKACFFRSESLFFSGRKAYFLHVKKFGVADFRDDLRLRMKFNKVSNLDRCFPPLHSTTHDSLKIIRQCNAKNFINSINET
jgi:hypothetical protein